MRRTLALAAVTVSLLVAAGCGDDGGDQTDTEAQLLDDPTPQECLAAMEAVLDRFEVPDSVDASDGLDDAEVEAVDGAMEEAADGYFEVDDADHPCTDALEQLPPEEFEEFMNSIDPEVLALLGGRATGSLEPVPEDP